MDISKQSTMQSSVTSAEFSSSQTYATSFSSMRQSTASHQSKMLVNQLQSNFSQVSMGNMNDRLSMIDQFMNQNPNDQQQLVVQNKFCGSPMDDQIRAPFFKQISQDDKQLALPSKFNGMDPNSSTDLVVKRNINFPSVMNETNGQLSLMDQIMNAKTYKEKKLLFQTNLLSPSSEEFNNFFRDRTFSNVANFSMTRTRAAQMSQTQVTKTVMNKIIKKRIIRKVVNGEVVEEEEEIDEIENEPTTQQFVINDARGFENIDMSVNLGNGGGGGFNGMALENPVLEIEGQMPQNSNLKAIEPPKTKTGIMGIFGMGKKSKPEFKNVGKLEPIMDELLKTEENYVKDLLLVVEEFMPELERLDAPQEIQGGQRLLLFGNIEIICMFHDVQFLTDLRECDKTPDDVASCFLKHRKEFSLYRHFNRNQPISEIYLAKYESFFQPKAQKLGLLNLRSYLIKPTQRLCRYILLMEELSKECKKHNIKAKDVEDTVDLLKKEIRLGNDLMALDAIKDCDMDLKDQGDLIFRNQFTVQKGKDAEYKAMVFLFEKIMLFTEVKLENNLDVLYYKDFIYLHEIGLTECSNDAKKFKVWFLQHTKKQYTLKTTEKEIKKKWVNEIRKQLQNELDQTKKKHEAKRTLIDLKSLNKDKQKKENK